MTIPSILTGSRIALVSDGDNTHNDYECTACGVGLRGSREVLAVPRRDLTLGTVVYSLVHNREECAVVVT